ncbi:Os09g0257832 [Oryza sativa Japonica Group]|uniref:Os09g0257832 protein n=1 Tax=Oryza sativa subsp. japonica TaxID=39947 RepID=A0A0P0XJ06_ORYSJ|nr:Os09g0257832 [Oryza sativa Japonica Group]
MEWQRLWTSEACGAAVPTKRMEHQGGDCDEDKGGEAAPPSGGRTTVAPAGEDCDLRWEEVIYTRRGVHHARKTTDVVEWPRWHRQHARCGERGWMQEWGWGHKRWGWGHG